MLWWRALVPVSAFQSVRPLSTRMRGKSTAVNRCRPSDDDDDYYAYLIVLCVILLYYYQSF